MRARSCIKLAMWLKLIPAKVGKDGKIQLDLLDLRVMAMSILFVVAFSAILSCHNVSKVEISAENICYMVNFMMGFGIFPICLINGFSATQVGSLLLTSNVNISGSALWTIFLLLCFFFAGNQLLLRNIYHHAWIIPFSIVLSVISLIQTTIYLSFIFICYLLVDDKLKEVEDKGMLTLKDVEEVILVSKSCSAGLELPGFILFLLDQLMLVVTIFICVAPSSSFIDVIGASLTVSICIVFLVIFVFLAESIYARLRQISIRGRSNTQAETKQASVGCSQTLRRILELNAKLDELEAVVPLTGAGFFNIEKGTITSIVGTTLTYAIILMQWKPATPASAYVG